MFGYTSDIHTYRLTSRQNTIQSTAPFNRQGHKKKHEHIRVHTFRTDQNSLTFPWHKFKFTWQYWSRKFYEISKKDTSGSNIPASSGSNVKFSDISLIFLQNFLPWHITEFPDLEKIQISLTFPWHVWTLHIGKLWKWDLLALENV